MEKKYAYWGIIAAMVIVALILLFRPLPTDSGAFCDRDCTYKTVNPTDPNFDDGFSAQDVCGLGCAILNISYGGDVAQMWSVYCECCSCVLVGGEMGLPDCADSGAFGYVYSLLRWCEFK